jgi:hypothetical protein
MGGYVYLICDPANDTYKIGVTRTLKSDRIKKLQTGNPTELHIVHLYEAKYPFRLEKMLHMHFSLKHELNEWYNLELEDIIGFPKTCEKLCDVIKALEDNPFFSKDLK